MIFELFIAFIFLALAFIVIGYYTQIKLLALFGFTTIFLLGLTVNLSGLTVKTGETVAYSYECTVCGTPSNTTYFCEGDPSTCDTYPENDTCLFYGCYWNETSGFCEGTASPCAEQTNLTYCARSGCTVSSLTTNGTVGINDTVIASTTNTYNYTALDDTATLWVGRWLMIVAILGFTLVIISNRVTQ